jgi:sugar O-acyltransferase (sialic acid O-acetyltransferase NeuD family)
MTDLSTILPEGSFDERAVVVYGGGGHGKSLIDLVRAEGDLQLVGIVDDGLDSGTDVMGVPVLGGDGVLEELRSMGISKAINAVGGIGDINTRVNIFEKLLQAGFTFPRIVHPTATVEQSAELRDGVQILPHAYIGTLAKLNFGVLINNGAIVSHDCTIGDYSGLAPGAMLAGEVHVGAKTQVGMGVTVNLRVRIGDNVTIGNSAVIKADVPPDVFVRAGQIWPVRIGD